MPVAQEDPSTQLPSTNHHPVFFTTTTTSTSTSSSTYISLTSAEAGGPPGAPAALAASAKEAAAHEAGGGRGGPGGHSLASTEVVIAALDVDTHKQLSHSHLGRFAPSLFYQGGKRSYSQKNLAAAPVESCTSGDGFDILHEGLLGGD